MDRRSLIVTGLASIAAGPSLAQATDEPPAPGQGQRPAQGQGPAPQYGPPPTPASTYSQNELVSSVSDFLGVTAESAGAVIERLFKENGRPTGYIAGEEGSAAGRSTLFSTGTIS